MKFPTATLLLALSGCATLQQGQNNPHYCGKAGDIAVYVLGGTQMACEAALQHVRETVPEAFPHGAWAVTYTWRYVGFDSYGRIAWGMTNCATRETSVRVFLEGRVLLQGPALRHELAHVADCLQTGHSDRD